MPPAKKQQQQSPKAARSASSSASPDPITAPAGAPEAQIATLDAQLVEEAMQHTLRLQELRMDALKLSSSTSPGALRTAREECAVLEAQATALAAQLEASARAAESSNSRVVEELAAELATALKELPDAPFGVAASSATSEALPAVRAQVAATREQAREHLQSVEAQATEYVADLQSRASTRIEEAAAQVREASNRLDVLQGIRAAQVKTRESIVAEARAPHEPKLASLRAAISELVNAAVAVSASPSVTPHLDASAGATLDDDEYPPVMY